MYRMTVRKKGTLIVALLVIFTTALLAGLILMQQQNQRAEELSDHSKLVLASARQLLWELVNAETGMRGYIISSNPIFLEPYNFAIKNVNTTRKRLEDLCANNPEQLELTKQMEASIADFLAYHESNKRMIESGQATTVAENTRRAEGKRRMDGLRVEVQQLLAIQEQIDQKATASSLEARSRMRWLLYSGLLLNFLVAGAMHTFLKQNITDRITQLINNNRMAAEGKPLGPAMESGDELADLDTQFRKLWHDKSVETTRSLNVYAKELERSNRDLQDFASVASHDLQEPLRKIMAFGSRLEGHLGSTLDDKGRDYLQRMRNAAERMSSLNESLLQLSRVRSKAGNVESVALESVVQGVLSDLQERIASSSGTVRCGKLPVIWADQHQMRQLFQNLISNALKFARTEQPPVVQIESRLLQSGLWEIVVQDNGIGFEQRFAEQIFRPFQRLHGRSEFEGNGIGLTIVEKIIARHGGSIFAESHPGKGTRFVITLPEKNKFQERDNEDNPTIQAAIAG